MRIVVDTSAWSFFLRRSPTDLTPAQRRLRMLIRDIVSEGRALLTGVVRQELLSGIRDHDAFERTRDHLRHFDDDAPDVADYEQAARFDNRCRAVGITPSAADMLICAIAEQRGLPILTLDDDFARYRQHLPIRLHAHP